MSLLLDDNLSNTRHDAAIVICHWIYENVNWWKTSEISSCFYFDLLVSSFKIDNFAANSLKKLWKFGQDRHVSRKVFVYESEDRSY